MRTQVVIVGGGPAGMLLAHLLGRDGVESVVVERQTRAHVLARIRAGVLEQVTAELLRDAGLGRRMDLEGRLHSGVIISNRGSAMRVDLRGLTGKSVLVYGQTEIQKDLSEANEARGLPVIYQAAEVTLHDLDSTAPYLTYRKSGLEHRIDADFIAGCDGAHGISRSTIPTRRIRTYERLYPFGWLGILAATPPVSEELMYASHDRGFALCSMRNQMLSRYYIQCSLESSITEWSDDRFWAELCARIPPESADRLVTGPSIEKSITPLRSFVTEPMQWGRLFLAGDAAHVVPPTGAKGLNLAVSDVYYLAVAIAEYYGEHSDNGLESYSGRALYRVWRAVRFSWWLTTLLHRFPAEGAFAERLQAVELDYLASSEAARLAMAEDYVGLAH